MTTQQTQHDLSNSALLAGLRQHLQPLAGDARQYDGLLALIGPARFALLGEASHGTHEFYRERAEITKRLITEKGFTADAVEADWPDTERQSHYFYTRLAQQFDAVIHIDETSTLEPLDVGQVWSDKEAPETFPSGI